MKKIFVLFVAVVSLSAISCAADDRPVKFDQLPKAARNFITENFAGVQITYAVKDDDIISPDYEVCFQMVSRSILSMTALWIRSSHVNRVLWMPLYLQRSRSM